MQGKLTTDCDGSVEHGKWQEPAGTLSMALTAYKILMSVFPFEKQQDQENTIQTISSCEFSVDIGPGKGTTG